MFLTAATFPPQYRHEDRKEEAETVAAIKHFIEFIDKRVLASFTKRIRLN